MSEFAFAWDAPSKASARETDTPVRRAIAGGHDTSDIASIDGGRAAGRAQGVRIDDDQRRLPSSALQGRRHDRGKLD
jgi:hypothetical protein